MNQKEIKESFIKDLQDQIWRKEMNIAFDLSKIPEIEILRDSKFKEHTDLQNELTVLDPADHTKETKTKKKELEKKIAVIEEFTLNCDETITTINVNVQRERQKSYELQARVKFAKSFEYQEPKEETEQDKK